MPVVLYIVTNPDQAEVTVSSEDRDPPDAATSRTHLGTLVVSAPGSMSGYSRDKFPHWIAQRDGTGVATGSNGYPTSGSWYSGAEWCFYARNWIQVKYVFALHITSAEKSALSSMLDTC
ncbi:MAG TPA: hypothetical protein VH373_00290 [Jatrophihabitantaceae bacterium]|jgi:hypothetical protein